MLRKQSNRIGLAAMLALLVSVCAPANAADEVDAKMAADASYRQAYQRYGDALREGTAEGYFQAAAAIGQFVEHFSSDARATDMVFFQAEALYASAYETRNQDRMDAAISAYDEYLKRFAAAGQALDSSSYVTQATFRRGESAFFAGKLKLSRTALLHFKAKYPNSASMPNADRLLQELDAIEFQATVDQVRQDVRANDIATATRRIAAVLQSNLRDPFRTRAFYLAGQIAALRNDWENTRRLMGDCIKGNTGGALSSAEMAEAHFWMAESLFRMSDGRKGMRPVEVRQAFATCESMKDSGWGGLVQLRLAQLDAEAAGSESDRAKWHAAIQRATAIAATYPKFELQFEADLLLGKAFQALGQLEKARGAFRRAVRHPKANGSETAAMAQLHIGDTLLYEGRAEDAVAEFLRVEVLHSWPYWQAASLIQAGGCYELLGRRNEAIDAYTKVASKYASQPKWFDEATQRMAKMNPSQNVTANATAALDAGRSR